MANILVVDDVQQITASLRRTLSAAGHEVTVANTVDDALAAMSQGPHDLVITDLFIPDRDGLEFIKEVRARYPSVKILAISGGVGRFPADPYLKMSEFSGAQRTLTKPFEQAVLLKSVSELLAASTP